MSQEKLDIYHRDIAPLLRQAAKLAEDAKINLAAFAGFPELDDNGEIERHHLTGVVSIDEELNGDSPHLVAFALLSEVQVKRMREIIAAASFTLETSAQRQHQLTNARPRAGQ